MYLQINAYPGQPIKLVVISVDEQNYSTTNTITISSKSSIRVSTDVCVFKLGLGNYGSDTGYWQLPVGDISSYLDFYKVNIVCVQCTVPQPLSLGEEMVKTYSIL